MSVVGLHAQVIVIQDGDLQGGQTYNWTKNNIYQLDGLVFLESGGVLNIEAGTVIQGLETPTTGDNTTALIITRDAKINAIGNASEPIIFTSELDDLSGSLTADDSGLWGGLVILGNGVIARPTGEDQVEGISTMEPRARYGGTNDDDDSGTLRYVSIRHGGAELAPGNEINGLTLGGVGRGTEIDYVEVFANSDDGIEWFGGAVECKHLVVAFPGDDGMDWDFGWRGKGQHWFVIMGTEVGNNAGEHDGASPDGQAPFSNPTIYNATYIGSGLNANADNEFALLLRDNTGGTYANSIFTSFKDKAISIEDLPNASGVDSYGNLLNGDLNLRSNVWWEFGAGNTLADIVDTYATGDDPSSTEVINHLANNGNQLADPSLGGISRIPNGLLDPRLNAGSPALNPGVAASDPFFDAVNYHGAFDNKNNWALGWTATDLYGYFGDLATPVVGGDIVIKDSDLEGGKTYFWTKENTYFIDGLVFLEEGSCLYIEPGTVIKGLETPSNGDNTSALIITRNACIEAVGTAAEPIVFTSELDDLAGSLTADDSGLWGGLVILGNGVIARPTGEDQVEGISTMEPRARYGGTNNDDDSGTLRYVSIRHGGAELAPGNEINGLTLGGVGRGTEIDYVEVFANSDDGIEWFGGAVECKHLLVAFPGDDGMDWDFGWRGKGQYWFVLMGTEVGNNAGEHDGASPDGQAPFSNPTIYNATYIGSGLNANADNEFALLLRDNTGGTYANSIFTSFKDKAISVEDLPNASGVDSYGNLLNGDLVLSNNLWWEFGAGNTLNDIVDTYATGDDPSSAQVIQHLINNNNKLESPSLGGISRIPNQMLDPRPNGGSPALTLGDVPSDPFFDFVPFKGAFDNQNNWALGWTATDLYGYFGDLATPATGSDIVIKDSDLEGGQTYFWTKENTYFIDGLVFLEAGSCLYIEAGTVIKGLETPSNGDNTSALIITRNACIEANGTAAEPIIFTSELDDLAGSLTADDSGLWGGLVILGNGVIARPTGEDQVEGISTMEPRARYGGTNDDDDSGTLRYVSIRHGGAELAPGNEINGLTLGGVGRGTEMDYIEVFANSDDGIEWFGGAVECKHLVVAFPGDDGMDWDFGWRGKGQHWFVILGTEVGNNAGEHDGASPDGQAPFSNPTIYNATYIGSGLNANADNEFALLMRDNTGGTYANSIFTSFKDKAISIEDLPNASGVDSYGNLLNGDLVIKNNYWWEFGAGPNLTDIVDTYANGDDPTAAGVIAHLSNNGNLVQNPYVCGISRNPDGKLNPTLAAGSNAAQGASAATDPFFDQVSYHGAFGADNWAAGWTALELYGYFNENCETVGTEDLFAEKNGFILQSAWPNPASAQANVSFTLPTADQVSLKVYDMQGRLVATPMNAENLLTGTYTREISVRHLANGLYTITLETPQVRLTSKLSVVK